MIAWTWGGSEDKKWVNDRHILKVELIGIVDTSEARCERRKGVRDDTKVSGLSK